MCLCLSVSLPPLASNTPKTMSPWQIVKRGKKDKSGRGEVSVSKRENKRENAEDSKKREKGERKTVTGTFFVYEKRDNNRERVRIIIEIRIIERVSIIIEREA